ncbi:MAG: hypothetical protein NTX82_02950 [Candidatus Parcubacteria bacterium]|nr:hypothetical protein [Candidatus Parcubacteria bacterium]
MDPILFPSQYKNAILNKTKNTTIRVKKEAGKYKTGHTYLAQSYAGQSWGRKIKITKIIKTTFDQLPNYGIPDRSIEAIKKKERMSPESLVEIIRFKIINA